MNIQCTQCGSFLAYEAEDRSSSMICGGCQEIVEIPPDRICPGILIGGDSGGPLFDLTGKLVGIHSRVGQVLQENMHVPSDEFIKNWDSMMKGEFLGEGPFAQKPVKGNGFLGFASEAHDGEGVKVTKVGEETPAAEAGLKVGDILLTANETKLSKREDIKELLKDLAVGDKIDFEVKRGEKTETITVTLGER